MRLKPLLLIACEGLALAAAAPSRLAAQAPVAGATGPAGADSAACPGSSAQSANAEIAQLLLVTISTGRAQGLENLRRARCLARLHGSSDHERVIDARLALQYGGDITVVEEAISCRSRGALSSYSDEDKRRALTAARACVEAFATRHPYQYALREELIDLLATLEAVASNDADSQRVRSLETQSNDLHNLSDRLRGIAPSVAPQDVPDFERARQIAERAQARSLRGAAQSESELERRVEAGRAGSEQQAREQYFAELQRDQADVAAMLSLRPIARLWALALIEDVSTRLLAPSVAERQSLLRQNVALWQNALAGFREVPAAEAVGIIHFNLAVAHRTLGESAAAIEHARQAISAFGAFSQRDRLIEAAVLLASELVYIGRTTDASTVLLNWLAIHGNERELFRNGTGRGRESPLFERLSIHRVKAHRELAAVLESDDRFGEAELFRRLALDDIPSRSGGGSASERIEATFDLAINLAAQGRPAEAEAVARERINLSTDLIGGGLERGLRAEKAASLAILLDRPDDLREWVAEAAGELGTFSLLPAALVRRTEALLLAGTGRTSEAINLLRALISDASERGEEDRELSWLRAELARVQLRAGDSAAAIETARHALRLNRQ